jgi:hypothetical protein
MTIKKINFWALLISLFFVMACNSQQKKNQETLLDNPEIEEDISTEDSKFVFSTWVHGEKEYDAAKWTKKLASYDSLGITELLVQASPEFLSDLLPLATSMNMKVHAWMWTLNQPGNKETQAHPEWYAVNRKGQNSLEYRAYVDYYQWLSPFHPEACAYIKEKVKSYCAVKGLASVHLDYVRYVDVILGADLQPKYGLKQETEMPEYDYGYHPIAREGFKAIFGKDPIEMEHPELSTEWRQYRLNAITKLVNEISDLTHEQNVPLTAAVFPFPEMSRQMVRQAWNDWNLDAAYPMLYHNFYREGINWIGFATKQGVHDVDFPIHAGLFSPALRTAEELEEAILITKENGAKGMCIFTADDLNEAQKQVFIKLKTIL